MGKISEINEIIDNFIRESREKDGYKIIFGAIENWETHYLSEEWADGGHILAIVFLRQHQEFIVKFIEKNSHILELDDDSIIYGLLSETVVYHTMQKTKKNTIHNSKAIASLPNLKKYEQKKSIDSLKDEARKQASELLRYIPVIGTSASSKLGHLLVDFINNTNNYYHKSEIPSVTNNRLEEYLDALNVSNECKKEYLKHFKL